MRYHRENDSVKSQSCEVTGGELTLAVDQLTILYNISYKKAEIKKTDGSRGVAGKPLVPR